MLSALKPRPQLTQGMIKLAGFFFVFGRAASGADGGAVDETGLLLEAAAPCRSTPKPRRGGPEPALPAGDDAAEAGADDDTDGGDVGELRAGACLEAVASKAARAPRGSPRGKRRERRGMVAPPSRRWAQWSQANASCEFSALQKPQTQLSSSAR